MGEKYQAAIYKLEHASGIEGHLSNKGFSEQPDVHSPDTRYAIKLFYSWRTNTPKWKGFIKGVVPPTSNALKERATAAESFVLLLTKKTETYAITGGTGSFAIQSFINPSFGFDILIRIINKNDRIIKAAREKSLIGGVLGATKHYRKKYTLNENDSFGKIYQELRATINKELLETELGFSEEDTKRLPVCIAKSSFALGKALSFEQLIKVIEGLQKILLRDPLAKINSIRRLVKRTDKALIESLENALYDQLWNRFQNPFDAPDFDLCHPDFDKYLTAASYSVSFGKDKIEDIETLIAIDTIFEQIRSKEIAFNNRVSFEKFFEKIRIEAKDAEGIGTTEGNLRLHLMGDVPHNGGRYFLIDSSWHFIEDAFLKDLDSTCSAHISNAYQKHSFGIWDLEQQDENDFSASLLGTKDTLVLDKVILNGIELCDVLHWDSDNLYFFHIKKNFGNSMRDLCSQVLISANFTIKSFGSGDGLPEKIYAMIESKKGGKPYFDMVGKQVDNLSLAEFQTLFKKKPIFVLAVTDVKKGKNRDIRNISQFGSSIAKFSVHELVMSMRGIGAELRFCQIDKKISE